MRIRAGMEIGGFVWGLVLFTGLVAGCRPTTSKNPVVKNTGDGVGSSGSGGSGSTLAAKLDPDCMNNTSYDACVFLQNPVAQRGSPFPSLVTRTTDLSLYQTYAVQITGLDSSGFLQNANFVVSPSQVQAVRKNASGNWKYAYSTCSGGSCAQDATHKISQLMAYYWLNFQVAEMKARTGSFFASAKAIPVDPFQANLANAYWDSVSEAIVLGEIANQDLAISAEVYLHEAGHANAHYAGNGAIEAPTALDINCSGNVCCSTSDGCPGAINEGQADFHAAMIFTNDTAIGETIENSLGGFLECGLPRNMTASATLTAAQAYNACPVQVRGEIHVLGRVYASVWWEVRKAAANKLQIDRLFEEHLVQLSATDDFETAATKINTLDTMLFGGAHVAAFNAQWAARGLTPK